MLVGEHWVVRREYKQIRGREVTCDVHIIPKILGVNL